MYGFLLFQSSLFFLILQVLSSNSQDQNVEAHEIRDFKTMITTKKELYVDKTLLIKEIMNCGDKLILITRPPLFGKSLALSTLDHFLSDQSEGPEQLFSGLNIMKKGSELDLIRNTHMNKYTVVKLDLSNVTNDTFRDSFSDIQLQVSKTFSRHLYLSNDKNFSAQQKEKFESFLNQTASKEDTVTAIAFLCECIHSHYNKTNRVVVLIDGYDVPIYTSYIKDYAREMVPLMSSILQQSLKENTHLVKAVVTGTTALVGGILPNHLVAYTIFDDMFSQFFGFTREDVTELLKRTGKSGAMEKIGEAFYGYNFGSSTVLNPAAVMQFLFKSQTDGWLNPTSRTILQNLLVGYGLYPVLTFQQLLAGQNVTKEASKDVDFTGIKYREIAYWTYLLHYGYLTVANTSVVEPNHLEVALRIPTLEISTEMTGVLEKRTGSFSMNVPNYKDFIENMVDGNFTSVEATMGDYLQDAGVYFKRLGQDIDAERFSKYVIQMLRGLELRYNTTMEVIIQQSWQEVSIRVKPKNNAGVPVRIVIKKTSMTRLMWHQMKKAFCPFRRKLHKEHTEIVIQYSKWCITSCLRLFVELKSGKIY